MCPGPSEPWFECAQVRVLRGPRAPGSECALLSVYPGSTVPSPVRPRLCAWVRILLVRVLLAKRSRVAGHGGAAPSGPRAPGAGQAWPRASYVRCRRRRRVSDAAAFTGAWLAPLPAAVRPPVPRLRPAPPSLRPFLPPPPGLSPRVPGFLSLVTAGGKAPLPGTRIRCLNVDFGLLGRSRLTAWHFLSGFEPRASGTCGRGARLHSRSRPAR